MVWPNTLIAFGALLIALGGAVATQGWNARTDALQKTSHVNTIAAELFVNLNVVRGLMVTETDSEELQLKTVLQRMKTVALESAISSGRFSSKEDRVLLTRLTELTEILRDFNNRLTILEGQMLRMDGSKIMSYRFKIRDSGIRRTADQKLVLLMQYLIEQFNIDPNQQFFVDLPENAA